MTPASPAFLTVEPTCPSESSLSQSKYFPSTTTPARSFGAWIHCENVQAPCLWGITMIQLAHIFFQLDEGGGTPQNRLNKIRSGGGRGSR